MNTNDPKLQRIRYDGQPYMRTCPKCRAPGMWTHHLWDCPSATVEDLRHHIEREIERKKWAQQKAETWLHQVRLMHGTLANLKSEVRRLRKRVSDLTKPSDTP